jgi:hypothetical protein
MSDESDVKALNAIRNERIPPSELPQNILRLLHALQVSRSYVQLDH